MLAPMLPHVPAITRCAQCQQFYWLDDAQVVGELEYGTPVPQAWQQARQVRALTHDEFQAALQAGLATTAERERYLRVHYWWSGNDPLREASAPRAPEYTLEERENFARLLELLDANEPADRLMMAEIHRETGNFDEALRLLHDLPDSHRRAAETIAALAQAHERVVRPLPLR